jgi:aryl-alcohol dehydrogenase-like predicted oxidoreductase
VRTRTLGAKGPEISVVGYGAWEAGGADWGPNASDDAVVDSMRVIFDVGINWIDTAEVYGQGRSEELVARAVAGRRDQVLIFTKVAPDDEGSGIRPEEIRRAIRGSLSRLQTDHVDLYQVHWPDDRIPVEDTWGAMAEVVNEGLALYIGVSNFDRERIERCLPIHPVTSVQNQFSLLHQEDRAELLPWLARQDIGYLAYSRMRRSTGETGGAASARGRRRKGWVRSPRGTSSGTSSGWNASGRSPSGSASRSPRLRWLGRCIRRA